MGTLGRRFLLWCVNEHNDFRIPEIRSLVSLFKINLEWIEQNSVQPYVVVDVQSIEDIEKIMSRSILIRSAYELWGRGNNRAEMHNQLRQLPSSFLKPYTNTSFAIKVETFSKTLTMSEKVKRIEEFTYLPLDGPIDLKNPEVTFLQFEYYSLPDNLSQVFFGRLICKGQRDKVSMLNLKNRKFIGNTSMDPQLSLIMANQALVESQAIVFDPFVGSGSVLVAAAHFGACVWGADIDYKLLHGKAKPTRCRTERREDDECVAVNLQQYNCSNRYMDVIVGDSSRSFWRNNVLFDSIITDPPYGIRESKEKVGKRKPNNPEIKKEHLEKHVPSKVSYQMHELYADLLNYAGKHLKVGGRLVFWIPYFFNKFNEEYMPKHPCLQLVSYSEQELAKQTSRYLITMTKIRHPKSEEDKAVVSEALTVFAKQYIQTITGNRSSRINHISAQRLKMEKSTM